MDEVRATVLAENPTEEEFRLIRRGLVTGTDIATIMGFGFGTPYSLVLEKRGLVPPREETDEMWVGKELEPTIIRLYQRKTGRKAIPNKRILAHLEHPWAGGTPDAFVDVDPLRGLECKAVGTRAAAGWGEPGTDEVPPGYYCQSMWYAGVCGGVDWDLIGLMGTKGQVHPIPFDAGVFGQMLEAGREFREKYLVGDAMPDPSAEDIGTVAKLFPRSDEAEMVEDPDVRILVQRLAEARTALSLAERSEKELKASLMARMGEKSALKGEGFKITWKNNKDRVVTDYEKVVDAALAKLPAKYADEVQKLLPQFTITAPGPRVFRCSGPIFKGGE